MPCGRTRSYVPLAGAEVAYGASLCPLPRIYRYYRLSALLLRIHRLDLATAQEVSRPAQGIDIFLIVVEAIM